MSPILDFVGPKGDGSGGDNWSYTTWKAPLISSPPINRHPTFYMPHVLPVAQPTVSEHWRENMNTLQNIYIYIIWGNGIGKMTQNVMMPFPFSGCRQGVAQCSCLDGVRKTSSHKTSHQNLLLRKSGANRLNQRLSGKTAIETMWVY